MYNITVSEEIKRARPVFKGVAVYVEVTNTIFCKELWGEINASIHEPTAITQADDIKLQPAIAAIREVYKRCGKDPSRYRPPAEALRRRLVRGLELYRIDALVDLINLVLLRTGYSIGGFDVDKVQGDSPELGIGRAEELFEDIGRGVLNIEGLPVYCDSTGGIGTLAGDNERTKMGLETQHILVTVNGYSGNDGLAEAVGMIQELLRKYIASGGGTVLCSEQATMSPQTIVQKNNGRKRPSMQTFHYICKMSHLKKKLNFKTYQ